jgi:hypothetical protein
MGGEAANPSGGRGRVAPRLALGRPELAERADAAAPPTPGTAPFGQRAVRVNAPALRHLASGSPAIATITTWLITNTINHQNAAPMKP